MKNEKFRKERRSFLKILGIGGAGAGVAVASGAPAKEAAVLEEYANKVKLLKEWKNNGIYFHEFLFPQTVPALLKRADRTRHVHVPIRNVGKTVEEEYVNWTGNDATTRTVTWGEKEIIESLTKSAGKDSGAHLYIIRIEDHPELFGAVISSEKLLVEDNPDYYSMFG